MLSKNLFLYGLVTFVGLRAIWQGVRGLQGKQTMRYGLLTGMLVKNLAPKDQEDSDRHALRAGSIMRLVFGVIITALGAYPLFVELAR